MPFFELSPSFHGEDLLQGYGDGKQGKTIILQMYI